MENESPEKKWATSSYWRNIVDIINNFEYQQKRNRTTKQGKSKIYNHKNEITRQFGMRKMIKQRTSNLKK